MTKRRVVGLADRAILETEAAYMVQPYRRWHSGGYWYLPPKAQALYDALRWGRAWKQLCHQAEKETRDLSGDVTAIR